MKTDSANTNFNLRHLRAIHMIWAEGSFARAAERLGVVPSALTETVRQLEEIAGGALFDRRSRPPEPTQLGLSFLRETAPLLDDLDLSLNRLRERAQGQGGRLRIGAAPSAISPIVAPAIARLRQSHPDLVITLHDDVAGELAERVADGRLDLAVAGRAQSSPELTQREIAVDPFGLGCHRDHSLAGQGAVNLAQIDPGELIHLDAHTGSAQLLADCPGLPAAYKSGHVRCYSTIAQLCLLRAGGGVALLPRRALELFNDPEICFVQISDLTLVRRLFLVQRKRLTLTPAIEAFLTALPVRA